MVTLNVRESAAAQASARDTANSLFEAFLTYRWPNNKPLLKATVREVGQFSGWGQAILRSSKLRHAKPDDEIGKHLTAAELFKLRTWKA